MSEQIVSRAFPHLARSLDSSAPTAEELHAQLLEDLAPLIMHDWRHANLERRSDPEAELMKTLGTTIPLNSQPPKNR